MTEQIIISYEAEVTASAFHNCSDFVRGIMGPIGSGKSVACLQELFRIGLEQQPGPDGVSRSRFAIIRNTYPELRTTTHKTFDDWFGRVSVTRWDTPIQSVISLDKGRWEMEFYFLAMDKPKDVKKLLSLELTAGFINEAKEVPKSVLDMLTGRVGRYPAKKDGGPTRACVIMDTNPPDDDHWWYKLFEEEKPRGYRLFKQPPALRRILTTEGPIYLPNPAAENVRHQPLGFRYWTQQVAGKREEWINAFIMGQYGSSHDGRPCYPGYNDAVHCAKQDLQVFSGLPLLIGIDFGRTPAAIIGQLSARGQLRVIDEVIVDAAGEGMGIRTFGRDVLKPYLNEHYNGVSAIYIWGDPSGGNKGNEEEDCFDILLQEGLAAEAAGSNAITFRLGNVEYYLGNMVDGEPAFLLSPKCNMVRKGFLGGYQFERLQILGEDRFKDQPKKNQYSHPHDGVQYLADLARHGTVKATSRHNVRPVQQAVSPAAWT